MSSALLKRHPLAPTPERAPPGWPGPSVGSMLPRGFPGLPHPAPGPAACRTPARARAPGHWSETRPAPPRHGTPRGSRPPGTRGLTRGPRGPVTLCGLWNVQTHSPPAPIPRTHLPVCSSDSEGGGGLQQRALSRTPPDRHGTMATSPALGAACPETEGYIGGPTPQLTFSFLLVCSQHVWAKAFGEVQT